MFGSIHRNGDNSFLQWLFVSFPHFTAVWIVSMPVVGMCTGVGLPAFCSTTVRGMTVIYILVLAAINALG